MLGVYIVYIDLYFKKKLAAGALASSVRVGLAEEAPIESSFQRSAPWLKKTTGNLAPGDAKMDPD